MKKLTFVLLLSSVFLPWSTVQGQNCIVDAGEDVMLTLGESIRLEALVNAADFESVSWMPTTYLSCSDCLDPEVIPQDDICYVITVVFDQDCTAQDTVCIVFDECQDGANPC